MALQGYQAEHAHVEIAEEIFAVLADLGLLTVLAEIVIVAMPILTTFCFVCCNV